MDEQLQRGFKGVWIPADLYLNDELSWTEKILIVEIDSLDKGEGCWASNEYLAKFLRKTLSQTANTITHLRKLGWVETIGFDGRKRYLRVTEKRKADLRKTVNLNTIYNNKDDNTAPAGAPRQTSFLKENPPLKEKAPNPPQTHPKPHPNPPQPDQQLIDYFIKRYCEEIADTPPVINWAVSRRIARQFISQLSLEKMKELVDVYFEQDDKFYKRVGWTLGLFLKADTLTKLSQINASK
jgi:hypothetical protein